MGEVDKANIDYPTGFSELLVRAYDIEKKLMNLNIPSGFCRNDLVPLKFIKSDDGMRLVDFDYAGNEWIAVDLGSATSQFEMTEGEAESFLRLYGERLDDG